jgi:hypothetical protein
MSLTDLLDKAKKARGLRAMLQQAKRRRAQSEPEPVTVPSVESASQRRARLAEIDRRWRQAEAADPRKRRPVTSRADDALAGFMTVFDEDQEDGVPSPAIPAHDRYSDKLRRGDQLRFGLPSTVSRSGVTIPPGRSRTYTITDEPPAFVSSRLIPVATTVPHPALRVLAIRRIANVEPRIRVSGSMRDWVVLLLTSRGGGSVRVDAYVPDNAAGDVSERSVHVGSTLIIAPGDEVEE